MSNAKKGHKATVMLVVWFFGCVWVEGGGVALKAKATVTHRYCCVTAQTSFMIRIRESYYSIQERPLFEQITLVYALYYELK